MTAALRGGVARLLTPVGGACMIATVGVQLLLSALLAAVATAFVSPRLIEQFTWLTAPVSPPVAVAGSVISLLCGFWLCLIAIRAFVGLDTPTRVQLSLTSLRGLVSFGLAGLLYTLAVTLGSIALVIPGLVLSGTLGFFMFLIATDGQGPVAALRGSWDLTRGHRLGVTVLVLLVSVGAGMLTTVAGMIGVVLPSLIRDVFLFGANATILLFVLAVFTEAFLQLSTPPQEKSSTPSGRPL